MLLQFVGVVHDHQPVGWRTLEEMSVESLPGAKEWSHSRMYHHLLLSQCLKLVEKNEGRKYSCTRFGSALARVPGNLGPIALGEKPALQQRTLDCDTLRYVLEAFVPSSISCSLTNLERDGVVLYAEGTNPEAFELKDSKGTPRLKAEQPSDINTVRWGAIPILLDLDILAEMAVTDVNGESHHAFFPLAKTPSLRQFEIIVNTTLKDAGADLDWIEIRRVHWLLATKLRIGPQIFNKLFLDLYSKYPERYDLPRTMEILEAPRKRSWISPLVIDGSVRSHVRMIKA
jgi:hypothetical protein